jgi:outer membrane protein TolC
MGVAASYTFWEWGKRRHVKRQREAQIALAHQNVAVTRDKIELEARQAYIACTQAYEAYQLATEMVDARKEAEKSAQGPAAVAAAKGETSKAELELLKAELTYRVAHAKLLGMIGP